MMLIVRRGKPLREAAIIISELQEKIAASEQERLFFYYSDFFWFYGILIANTRPCCASIF